MGCPAYDFARLFSSCLSGKERREHWEELLEEFYGYLKEEIDGMEIPYTLEQLKEAYCRIIPICGIMIVPVIVPLFDILCNDPDEEQKKKSLNIAMEKTECLLDDMFYYHERNMKRRRGEQAV
ncbi:hypothetical protein NECAME_14851 [Necator americanus]|uniref:CHK kinase-like domain-containing protein n=1 Tax=Necator americanus TaxID=51031 RepID=W2SNP9_NECAM|nr:hypothetical protein NECAME_14851 [Necator americanus]ETN70322.1 hypothetical protein NECAME_14851 [Necator americanus]